MSKTINIATIVLPDCQVVERERDSIDDEAYHIEKDVIQAYTLTMSDFVKSKKKKISL